MKQDLWQDRPDSILREPLPRSSELQCCVFPGSDFAAQLLKKTLNSLVSEEFCCLQGGEQALQAIVRKFGKVVLTEAPKIKELIEGGHKIASLSATGSQTVLESLECLRVAGPVMEPELNPQLKDWLRHALKFLVANDSTIRLAAARSAVAVVRSRTEVLMNLFMECALLLNFLSNRGGDLYNPDKYIALVSQATSFSKTALSEMCLTDVPELPATAMMPAHQNALCLPEFHNTQVAYRLSASNKNIWPCSFRLLRQSQKCLFKTL